MNPETRDAMRCLDPEPSESLEDLIRGLRGLPGALDLAIYDEAFLRKVIAKRMAETGLTAMADYGGYLAQHAAEAAAFHQALRISYSEFFRNPLAFALLEQRILPALIAEKKLAGRGEVRIWSAGCAAGQEAWSVAILLDELTRAEQPPAPYRIFASDLSEPELAVGRAGVYSAEAVGNVRARHLDGCFTRQDVTFGIAPRLRQRVDFSFYDLLDESSSSPQASIYGGFDLILCCNLLFYYRPAIQQRILDKLCRALVPGGYLVTGDTELKIVANHHGLRAVIPPVAVFQKVPGSNPGGFSILATAPHPVPLMSEESLHP